MQRTGGTRNHPFHGQLRMLDHFLEADVGTARYQQLLDVPLRADGFAQVAALRRVERYDRTCNQPDATK